MWISPCFCPVQAPVVLGLELGLVGPVSAVDEIKSFICNLYFTVTARATVFSMLIETLAFEIC